MADKRAYVAGRYAVELDGSQGGWLFSAEGGEPSSDVVQEKLGPDKIIRKHIAGVKYGDITLTFGAAMGKALYSWVKDSFDHKYSRKNGAIIAADFDAKERSRLSFYNALITEVGLPALDAASKDAAKMTLKMTPEYTRKASKDGGSVVGNGTLDAKKAKSWLPSNFRLRIDGLDDACKKVSKIEALTIKQKNSDDACGELRDYPKEPAHLEIPNLVITCSESHADALHKWHEDFVIKGNCGDDKEKGGTLEYLDASLSKVLFTVTFEHLGIFKLTTEKVESNSENRLNVKAEMYCENMKWEFKEAFA